MLAVAVLVCASAGAEKFYIQSYSVSSYLMQRELKNQRFAFNGEPDFANYIYHRETSYPDYGYHGIAANIVFGGGIALEGRYGGLSEVSESYFGVRYYHKPWISYSIGYFSTEYLRSRIERFQDDAVQSQFLTQSSEPLETTSFQDRGAEAGIHLAFGKKRLHYAISLNAGMSRFNSFDTDIMQQSHTSNYRQWTVYRTKEVFQPFVRPELSLDIDCIVFRNSALGVRLYSNVLVAKRSMPYTKTVYAWTNDNYTTESVAGAQHLMTRIDAGLGIYFRFLHP